MADNYLEKKMDDYRRGNINTLSRRRSSSGANPSALPILAQRIAIAVENEHLTDALLSLFQQIGGLKVAFVGTDYRKGNQLAQNRGALFVKVPSFSADAVDTLLSQAATRWGGVDALISDNADSLTNSVARRILIDTINSRTLIDTEDHQNSTISDFPINRIIASLDSDVKSIAHAAVMLLTVPSDSTTITTTITL